MLIPGPKIVAYAFHALTYVKIIRIQVCSCSYIDIIANKHLELSKTATKLEKCSFFRTMLVQGSVEEWFHWDTSFLIPNSAFPMPKPVYLGSPTNENVIFVDSWSFLLLTLAFEPVPFFDSHDVDFCRFNFFVHHLFNFLLRHRCRDVGRTVGTLRELQGRWENRRDAVRTVTTPWEP